MQPKGEQLQRGSVFCGYRIEEQIGRGGMGMVFRARNVALNRIYALKVLTPELAEDEGFRERFKREMHVAASLHHPNVVGIHYAGEEDGWLFLAMDFIYGTDLRELLRRSGALDPERAVDLLSQAASALDTAHSQGLVHRDVKPANILITVKDGAEHAYLTDFGLAKRFDDISELTATGVMVGTVDYMAPEQITGGRVDARTDIYGLGCVFFQMLSGRVPYERDTSVAKLFAHVSEPPPALETSLAETYPTFGAVIDKAMAKDPDDRYMSAGDFARDAAAALRGSRFSGSPTVVAHGEARPVPASGPGTEGPLTEMPAGPLTEMPAGPLTEMPAAPLTEMSPGAPTEVPAAPPTEAPSPPTVAPPSSGPPPAPPSSGPPPAAPPPSSPPPSATPTSQPAGAPSSRRRYVLAGALLLIVIAAVVVVIAASPFSSSTPPAPTPDFAAAVRPVPTNRVTGNGTATVALQGNVATVTVNTAGLLNAVHLMHIHAGGRGLCPPASAARVSNGHRFISTTDGLKFYGGVVEALTQTGDTSPASFLAFSRYPSGSAIRYRRTFTLQRGVGRLIRDGNAVVVVHGIDYDHSGVYDEYLGRSELTNSLTADATAPALCGTLRSTKSSPVPFGAVMADGRRNTPSPGTVYMASLTIMTPSRSASAFGGGMPLLCGAPGVIQ